MGLDEGIAIDAPSGLGLGINTGLSIAQNTINGNATAGIAVRDNSLAGSTLSKNTVSASGDNGLVVQAGNSGNLIEKNKLKGNGTYDCYDEPGNVNTWKNDQGKTQNRAGLCKGAKVV